MIKKRLDKHNFLPRERRVFRIDVSNIPEDRIQAYIDSIRDAWSRPRPVTIHPFNDPLESPLERQARLKRERRRLHGRPRRLY